MRIFQNQIHIIEKRGVINGVDPNCHPGFRGCIVCNFFDQMGMLNFAAYWGAIFTVQGDIKDAGAKLLRHFCLQLQAFAHPHFDTTVVITHRQKHACGL
jgi:hypothetical protein